MIDIVGLEFCLVHGVVCGKWIQKLSPGPGGTGDCGV
jgi:hypothetical protein